MFYKNLTIANMKTALLGVAFALTLTACGGGESNSGGINTTTAVQLGCGTLETPPGSPLNSRFCSEFWLKDTMQNNCASCHVPGGTGTPAFMQGKGSGENINDAAESLLQTSTQSPKLIVDLANPSQSYIVEKMQNDHNCWASATVCADIVLGFIENWAGGSLSGREITLTPPANANFPGGGKAFPASATDSTDPGDPNVTFEQIIYNPILRTYCIDCHDQGPGDPLFADGDVNNSFILSQPRMNLDDPSSSRYVSKLLTHTVGCWDANDTEVDVDYRAAATAQMTGDDCNDSRVVMRYAIEKYAENIVDNAVDPNLFLISRATSIPDGVVASGGSRYEAEQIALYEFKSGPGSSIAYDTSGAGTALDLTLGGNTSWVGGWGISINGSGVAARGSTTNTKIYDMIQTTGEYSIETWVAPNNVTQENARIINYSVANDGRKNFALSQTQYNYDAQVRSDSTGLVGEPTVSTPMADEVLQATLQHVVVTYDSSNGRQIYVNGVLRSTGDPQSGGSLSNWDSGATFVLGNEFGAINDNNLWRGVLKMVSIHNRALTQDQITQNFTAGVGEKFFLLFDVSHVTGMPTQSYIVFTVSQFDDHSYLFTEPKYVSLNTAITNVNIPIRNMRIGINSNPAAAGQAYVNINKTIATNGESLSDVGTTIALQGGSDQDEFYLIFEELGLDSRTYTAASYPARTYATPDAALDIGLKTFDEINATFSDMLGVSTQAGNIPNTYALVKQQLPAGEDPGTFVTAHNIGIAQLAMEYCETLVNQEVASPSMFTSAMLNQTATADPSGYIDRILAAVNGTGMDYQMDDGSFATGGTVPDAAGDTYTTKSELIHLVGQLNRCIGGSTNPPIPACNDDVTQNRELIKSVCTAALSSANSLIQ